MLLHYKIIGISMNQMQFENKIAKACKVKFVT